MNKEEWDATCGWMEACFKGELTDEREATYARYLQQRERSEVMTAIDRLVLEGQVFLPAPGELVGAMVPALPPFQEVWSRIEPVLRHATMHGERRCIELIRECAGDLIAGWVATYGAVRLAMEPVYDPDLSGVVRNRLSQSWKESTESHERRVLTAMEAERRLSAPARLRLQAAA